MNISLPHKVQYIIDILYNEGYEAFAVGGCIRDSLLGKSPQDWDITTSAFPDAVEKLFDKTIPTGIKHGTVTVIIEGEAFEVTTYRTDGTYINNRRPETVSFVSSLKEDLARRDFTINALAYNTREGLKDYYSGIDDLNKRVIETVGNADIRFQEDALRLLRAVRFSCQLDFSLDPKTLLSIKNNSSLIKNISKERIREELNKILLSPKPSKGFLLLESTGLLKHILPEVQEMVGMNQHNPHHDKDIFLHTLAVIDNSPRDITLRLSALLHDIGKPRTFSIDKKGIGHFYGHDELGVSMTDAILKRLTYDNKTINLVKKLVKHHMLVFKESRSPVLKRTMADLGKNNMKLLFSLQRADIKSSAPPFNLSAVDSLEEKTKKIIKDKDPIYIKDLNITGEDLVRELNIEPGKIVGEILNHLLDVVLERPFLNEASELLKLSKLYYVHIQNKGRK